MKVVKIYNLMRNDCSMDLECEHCGHKAVDNSAYNDSYYIHTVVPQTRYCIECEKNSLGELREQTT